MRYFYLIMMIIVIKGSLHINVNIYLSQKVRLKLVSWLFGGSSLDFFDKGTHTPHQLVDSIFFLGTHPH